MALQRENYNLLLTKDLRNLREKVNNSDIIFKKKGFIVFQNRYNISFIYCEYNYR